VDPQFPGQVAAGYRWAGRDEQIPLHLIEHGKRDVTLSEIVALANALEITPSKLIRLPILTPANRHTDATTRTAAALTP
jgi:hypothetical protein